MSARITTTLWTIFFLTISSSLLFLAASERVYADALPANVLERTTCSNYSVDIAAYGTGMLQGLAVLEATTPTVAYTNAEEGCAVVVWDTSAPAATNVVYAPRDTSARSVMLAEENYGYSAATLQNNAGDVHHVVILDNLDAANAYEFRTVSRAHPTALPRVSDAYTIAFQAPVVSVTPPVVAPAVPQAPPTNTVPEVVEPPHVTPVEPVTTVTEEPNETEVEAEPVVVPSAVTAANDALKGAKKHQGFIVVSKEGVARIVKTLFALSLIGAILAGVYWLVRRFTGFKVSNPILVALGISAVIAIGSVAIMLYYFALIAIAIFLALLAWYLIKSVPAEEDAPAPIQPKLLDSPKEVSENSTTKS